MISGLDDATYPNKEPRVPTIEEQIQRRAGMQWWERQRETFAGFEIIPHLFRLLAQGKPIALDRLAAECSRSVREVEAALRSHPGVDWDEHGRLLGFGLTLRPTAHRFSFEGGEVYAFCASDALSAPVILGRAGVIHSKCPTTGLDIHIEVTPKKAIAVEPAEAVVSLLRPEQIRDVRTEVCGLGLFFASENAARVWLEAHPDGMVHGVKDDFELHRDIVHSLGWQATK